MASQNSVCENYFDLEIELFQSKLFNLKTFMVRNHQKDVDITFLFVENERHDLEFVKK